MRLKIISLIASKEIRDLIRDRRTVALILVLPAVLYPLFGVTGYMIAREVSTRVTTVGVYGVAAFPGPTSDLPRLIVDDKAAKGLDSEGETQGELRFRALDGDPDEALREKQIDVALLPPPGLIESIRSAKIPVIQVMTREGDDKSKMAGFRVMEILRAWQSQLRERRFQDKGLPKDFDKILTLEDVNSHPTQTHPTHDDLQDSFTKMFPLILMMWILAGAIQPAIDLTAGEKERGTMETLLISPAERTEIVLGKFLAATAFVLGVFGVFFLWLALAGVIAHWLIGYAVMNYIGLIGCVILGLPTAMFFSSVCIALGVFAKSTKEGQYYLLPLVFTAMPLAFWTMVPGSELSSGNCWIPITGPMLLQQRLLSTSPEPIPWKYFAPVLGASAFWVSLSLILAVRQFHRESVLFREGSQDRTQSLLAGLFRRNESRES